jgi:hypothetical protein
MKRYRFLRVAAVALTTVALTASPALARTSSSFERFLFEFDLSGIDDKGNLTGVGEDDANFVVLINTRTGKFCFKARGSVLNYSGHRQSYGNEDFIYYNFTDGLVLLPSDITICSSCYKVAYPSNDISAVTYFGTAVYNVP